MIMVKMMMMMIVMESMTMRVDVDDGVSEDVLDIDIWISCI